MSQNTKIVVLFMLAPLFIAPGVAAAAADNRAAAAAGVLPLERHLTGERRTCRERKVTVTWKCTTVRKREKNEIGFPEKRKEEK